MADHRQLIAHLEFSGEVSLQSKVNSAFAKTLLLSVASYFESKITDSVIQVFQDTTSNSDALVAFVRSKAVTRRYHEWFAWDRRNANHFFGAFGPDFSNFMQDKMDSEPAINDSIRAFLELGNLRNRLVHQNYAVLQLDKTVEEVYLSYQIANRFVESIPNYIREHIGIPLI